MGNIVGTPDFTEGFTNSSYSYIEVNTGNGQGSTATKIRRFSNTVHNIGSDITFADDATNGSTFTINTNGIYLIQYIDRKNTGANAEIFGISKNATVSSSIASQLTSSLGHVTVSPAEYPDWTAFALARLSSTDVIRAHVDLSDGSYIDSDAGRTQFKITLLLKI